MGFASDRSADSFKEQNRRVSRCCESCYQTSLFGLRRPPLSCAGAGRLRRAPLALARARRVPISVRLLCPRVLLGDPPAGAAPRDARSVARRARAAVRCVDREDGLRRRNHGVAERLGRHDLRLGAVRGASGSTRCSQDGWRRSAGSCAVSAARSWWARWTAGVKIETVCERLDAKDFLLMNRGFQWVHGSPFDR